MTESIASRPLFRRVVRSIAIAVGIVAFLILAAWLAIPPIVRSQLESRLTQGLHRQVTVEGAAFNPFGGVLTLRNVKIANSEGATPLLAVDELVADVSSASVWHRAPVFDSLRVVRPAIAIARDRNGKYNVQDLIEDVLSGPSDPPRLSLNNIEIVQGSIAFDDGVTGRKHALSGVDIGIPFLSSLPHETNIRVTPHVAGTFNGSHFQLGGTTEPFAERREATLDIDIDALPVAPYVVYAAAKPPVDITDGVLTAHLQFVFVEGQGDDRRLELRGNAQLDRLAVKRRDGSVIAGAERIGVALDRLDAWRNDVHLTSVTIDAPAIDVKRTAQGELEWAVLGATRTEPPKRAASPAEPAPPWKVAVDKVAVRRGTVKLADATSDFESTLTDVTLDATNLKSRGGEKAHAKLAFVTATIGASFNGEADIEPTTGAATGRFTLAKFALGALFPYYKSALALDVQKGSLDYQSSFVLDAEGNLHLTGGEATISDMQLAVRDAKDPLWRVPQLAAHEVDVDARARTVGIAQVDSRGAVLRLVREADGTLEMSHLLRAAPKASAVTTAASKPAATPAAAANAIAQPAADTARWTLAIKKLALEGVAIDAEDRVPKPPVKLALRELSLTTTDVSNARGAKSDVTLRTRVGERGRISLVGPITTRPFAFDADVEVSRVALSPAKAYVEPHVNVVLVDGALTAKGRLHVDLPDSGSARVTWKGNVAVTDFASLNKRTATDLLRWKTLSADVLDVATAPFRASADRITLDDFYARLIVYQDGTLNLQRLLTPGESPEPPPEAAQAAAKTETGTTTAPAPVKPGEALPLAIREIALTHGTVQFSDFFVRPNYSTRLTDVSGTVTAMSAERAGDVAIAAKVEGIAPVDVQGRIQPFAKEMFLDLTGKARDIDLPPLTPYSAKYAGYGIEKGKLSFDIHYKVENRKLTAENHITLDQLTFGEHVDSPTATKLPVLLAVSLLKNRNGVIDVRLPISGSLDDPQFSVGGLIIQMIVNLIGKAVTAPFALIGAVFGGGSAEELSTLPFAAGSATIGPDAQQRVDAVGKALADRPGIKLEIGGRADPVADREALRQAAVERAMRREKMKSLAASGEAPSSLDAVTIAADERERWLTAAYREAPIKDRPRNAIGMLKEVPAADMEAMLAARARADDDALRQLANARAIAVKETIAAHGVSDDRLFIVAPKLGDEAGSVKKASSAGAGPPARVDLALR